VQLDNSDEQAAQVRRELDSRLSSADEMTKVRALQHPARFYRTTHAHSARRVYCYFARLANTPIKDEESARDSRVLACNSARYSPILEFFSLTDSAINLS